MALQADSSSGITTYNLSAGKSAPQWMKERMNGKSLRYNDGKCAVKALDYTFIAGDMILT